MLPPTFAYRHDDLFIPRPYGIDVDAQDWLWEGTTNDRLLAHHLRTAERRIIHLPALAGHVVYSTFVWDDKLVLTLGDAPFYLVYTPATGHCRQVPLAGKKPIVWYGARLPNGKLLLCDRGGGAALLLDGPDAAPRAIPCPYAGDFGHASVHGDGLAYTFMGDPARVVRFDPASEKFVDERPLPWPEVGVSGRFDHRGVLYCADSAGGRLLPLDLATQRWFDPIAHPDHRKVFGFIGGGFSFQGRGYYCLSTYSARSRLDRSTGRVIVPDGPLSVDGKPYRFMQHYLVFDPETRAFEYLTAPAQGDDTTVLLCYAWTDGQRFAITGLALPHDEPGVPRREQGYWLVLQSTPADREPGFAVPSLGGDRDAFLRERRRAYAAHRALFLTTPVHVPPIVNARGQMAHYLAGQQDAFARRAAHTDADAYWRAVVASVCARVESDADRVKAILRHVRLHLFYNPIQELQLNEPIAVHEAREGRCGQAQKITLKLFAAAGLQARPVDLFHHCVAEVFYDGTWHHADPLFFGSYQPARDGRVLSSDELRADPYFADAWSQDALAYDPELLMSTDGYQVEGYVFGPWGAEPFYSYYLGAPYDLPPTLPTCLPATRLGSGRVRLNWARSVKLNEQPGELEYQVRVCRDRERRDEVWRTTTRETAAEFAVPEMNRMYFQEVTAMDSHRAKNPKTWYPATVWNFVLVPPEQYGWYGVL